MNLPAGQFQQYPTAQAFQVEHGSVRSNQQGVNFDLGSNISVDWVDLKMLTMISSSVAMEQSRGPSVTANSGASVCAHGHGQLLVQAQPSWPSMCTSASEGANDHGDIYHPPGRSWLVCCLNTSVNAGLKMDEMDRYCMSDGRWVYMVLHAMCGSGFELKGWDQQFCDVRYQLICTLTTRMLSSAHDVAFQALRIVGVPTSVVECCRCHTLNTLGIGNQTDSLLDGCPFSSFRLLSSMSAHEALFPSDYVWCNTTLTLTPNDSTHVIREDKWHKVTFQTFNHVRLWSAVTIWHFLWPAYDNQSTLIMISMTMISPMWFLSESRAPKISWSRHV